MTQSTTTLACFRANEVKALKAWLPMKMESSAGYFHYHIVEDSGSRKIALPIIAEYIRRAHQDAINEFKRPFENKLDPRNKAHDSYTKALAFYPRYCEKITLQGFFGEILAGLLIELYDPHTLEWGVPKFNFSAHDLMFQELLTAAATGRDPRRALGHFGDDCLAFTLDEARSRIDRILVCEAKCTLGHSSSLIIEAHVKINDQPIEVTTMWLHKIIESIRKRSDTHSNKWVFLLEEFKDSDRFIEASRDDLVSYTHGHMRANGSSKPWISSNKRSPNYTSNRDLACLEVHIGDISELITKVYELAFP